MTDDEAKARIDVLHDEAAAILAEQGLSPVQAYCFVLEWVTVRHEPTLKLLAEAAAYDKWFRDQVAEGIAEADDAATKSVSNEDAKAHFAKKRAELMQRMSLAQDVQEAIDDPRPNIPHDQVMGEMDAEIRAMEREHEGKKRKP